MPNAQSYFAIRELIVLPRLHQPDFKKHILREWPFQLTQQNLNVLFSLEKTRLPIMVKPAAQKQRLSGFNEVAHQALLDAIDKHGRRIGGSEHYPSNRKIVEATYCYSEFKLRRASDKTTPKAMRKSFNRARDWLQANDYVREYEDKIWFIDDPDRQDK